MIDLNNLLVGKDGVSLEDRIRLHRYMSSKVSEYVPWENDGRSPQRRFHGGARYCRKRVYRAGNRTGKTTAGAWEAWAWVTGWAWWLGLCPFKPPVHIWCSGLDWVQHVGGVMWPAVKEWVDWDDVRSVNWFRKQEPEIPTELVLHNGSTLTFKSAEAGRDKYQGQKLHGAWTDEEHPTDVIEELRARLLDYGGHLWVTCTPVRRERWIQDMEREDNTLVVRASMRDAAEAGLLDEEAVEDYLSNLPDRQAKVRDLGDFAALEGLVWGEFHRDTHTLVPRDGGLYLPGGAERLYSYPLPQRYSRWAAMDFGYGVPAAVVVVAEDNSTTPPTLIVERVLYSAGIRASKWADILEGSCEYGGGQEGPVLPPLAQALITDHDAAERAELRAKGVDTRPAFKDVVPGLESVERMMEPRSDNGMPRLLFIRHDRDAPRHPRTGRIDAEALCWEIEGYRYPETKADDRKDPSKDLPVKKDDHACDALRYLVACWERTRKAAPPLPSGSGSRRKPPMSGLADPPAGLRR